MRARAFILSMVLAVTPVLGQAQGLLGIPGFGQTGTGKTGIADPTPGLPSASMPKTGMGVPVSPANASSVVAPQTPQTGPDVRSDVVEEVGTSKNPVFGAQLFTGAFARKGPTLFNPDYLIAIGDSIRVTVWGSVTFDGMLIVDPQGNVLLPNVGPVKVAGVRNQDLQATAEKAIRRIYKSNVYSYASLAEAQPVRIFVGGFVKRPGLYNGTSMDSLLHYLDEAGGIDVERGSFLNVQVKRSGEVRVQINLYEFLLEGRIPQIQLADGDVIFVSPRQHVVSVGGLAENAKRFEFAGPELNVGELVKLAKPRPQATHIRITRNTGIIKNIEYYSMGAAKELTILNGDEIEFTADKRPGTITVRVQGEHLGPQEYELPYGTRLGELTKQIVYSERSDVANLQLFRLSIKDRQKTLLQTSLKSLESAVLTARSGTYEESLLRASEAALILQWVERAKAVEPVGQVLIAQGDRRDDLLLENGDVIQVPVQDGLVLVGGEVLFPNTLAFESGISAEDYIQRAGGYTQNADMARVVIAHRDGSFEDGKDGFFSKPKVRSGDHILVLPKVDMKYRQIAKEIAQIMFQMALMAGVALRGF